MKWQAGREDVRSPQLPFWMEFEVDDEDTTLAVPREDFVFKARDEIRVGDWRFRASTTSLFVEYWNGAAWVLKHTFT